ncbi:hypothetical protein K2173_013097 [Erythroxylum novogranatense]|uniref:Uncharacterized protein n=1 Tax=Erythroxylum novogranatense TaxID=1862640 RepID=A0AAV8S4N8_9ROSI|nr:hypothetical protein K2173_013097 [Erythroxylum novogranatense]
MGSSLLRKGGVEEGRWTAEEDEALRKYIEANGEGSWRSLPKNAGLLRCGKSCRLRWINYLRNDLKRGNISTEEEEIMVKLHASLGNSRKVQSFRRVDNDSLPLIVDLSNNVGMASKRKGGRTSRWAMKKNKTFSRKDVASQPKRPNTSSISEKLPDEVPLPQTPDLERETTVPGATYDPLILDACVQDTEQMDLIISSPSQETGAGFLDSREQKSLGLCVGEVNTNETSGTDEMLGSYGSSIDGEMLCFDDIIDNQLVDPNGVLVFNEEKQAEAVTQRGVDELRIQMDQSFELHSCTASITSCFDDNYVANWSWEDMVTGHELFDQTGDNDLCWLWESDGEAEVQKVEEMKCDKKNAMVAWLLS